MLIFNDLITAQQPWLVKRAIHYAKVSGYMQYTSTQRLQWEQAVEGLCKGMGALISQDHPLSEFAPAMDFTLDPVIAFGVEQAERHRERGVSLEMFFGLLKYFRRAFTDLVEAQNYSYDEALRYSNFVVRFFDHVEMGVIDCWTNLNTRELLAELQEKNRLLVVTKVQYDLVKASMPVPMVILTADGNIIDYNQGAQWLFADTPVANQKTPAMQGPNAGECLQPVLNACQSSSDRVFICPLQLPGPAGPQPYDAHCSKIIDLDGQHTGIIIVLVRSQAPATAD